MKSRSKTVFIIIVNSMGYGGAQKISAIVANDLNRCGSKCILYWIKTTDSSINAKILDSSIVKHSGFFGLLRLLISLATLKINKTPFKIISFLYISDLLSLIIGKLFNSPVYWNIRNEVSPFLDMGLTSKICFSINKILSSYVDRIIFCSKRAMTSHEYNKFRSLVISNPFLSREILFSQDMRNELRLKFNLTKNDIVLAFIGRNANVKNFPLFVESINLLLQKGYRNIYSIVYGDISADDEYYIKLSNSRFHLGCFYEANVKNVYSLIDILCITSYSEGSSNILIEAISAHLPVIVHSSVCQDFNDENIYAFDNYSPEDVVRNIILSLNNLTLNINYKSKIDNNIHPIANYILTGN